MIALSARNLSVHFPGSQGVAAVNGIDLDIDAGEIVALVGESGSGKTATANALMGLLDRSWVSADSIRLGQQDISRLDERRLRRLRGREISMVFQEPLTALDPVIRIGSQVAAVLRRHRKMNRQEAKIETRAALARMGLGDPDTLLRRYPHELSGGMRQRVLIAMAMAGKPSVLLADEPTTALDVTTQAQVLDELMALGRENGTAILLITHDLGVASRISDRILVMRAGQIVESASVDELFANPRHPYTAELLNSIPRLDAKTAKAAKATGAPLLSLQLRRISHPVRVGGKRRRLVAVRDVSLDIRRGEILGLVGESGCGKSTLAQSLVGLRPAESGAMRFGDSDISGMHASDWARVRRHTQLVFQDPRSSLSPRRTVGQSLREPLDWFQIDTPAGRSRRIEQSLERVGLEPGMAARYPHELSGGQRQRVALARALISEPDLIVADEPLSSLDVSIQARIIQLLRELRKEMGFALLIVSHDLAVVRQLADRVAVMYLGRIVESAPADDLFERPAHPYTRALLEAVPQPGIRYPVHRRGTQRPASEPASLLTPPPGCVFHTRCPEAMSRCSAIDPLEIRIDNGGDTAIPHLVRCLLHENSD